MRHNLNNHVKTSGEILSEGYKSLTPLQQDYAKWLGKFLIGSAATGAALKGGLGLADLVGQNLKATPSAPEPLMINIPYKQYPDEPKLSKRASTPTDEGGFWNWFLKGPKGATSAYDIPAAWPATFLGGGAAVAGGYAGMNALVNKYKKKKQEEDLEDSRADYEQALLEQFKPISNSKIKPVRLNEPSLSKIGSDLDEKAISALLNESVDGNDKLASIAKKLDTLTDRLFTKQSEDESMIGGLARGVKKHVIDPMTSYPNKWDPSSIPGWAAPKAMGIYSILAPILGLSSGALMYNYAKDNDPEAERAKELRKQIQDRKNNRPADVYARLLPVDDTNKIASLEDDEINTKAVLFVKNMLGE